MVTNLPVEARLKWVKVMEAKTPQEKLKALQEFLSAVPKHKGTENLVRQVRRQIAQLRREIEEERRRRKGGKGPKFFIEKEGAGQVVLIGLTNCGKSSILASVTNAKPQILDTPYTTREPIPGMLNYEDVQIQLIEAPAIIEGASEGVAWGLKTIGLIRNADAVAIAIDMCEDPVKQFKTIIGELENSRISIFKSAGRVVIEKKNSGGIQLALMGKLKGATLDDVKKLLESYRIYHALVKIFGEVTLDDIEDSIFQNRVFKPAVIIANKMDCPNAKENLKSLKSLIGDKLEIIPVSAKTGMGLDKLGPTLYRLLDIVRVYTKQPNQDKPSDKPLIVKKGTTVLEVARLIHSSLYKNFKYAKIWGPSVKYPGQRVGGEHIVEDGDIVEIHA